MQVMPESSLGSGKIGRNRNGAAKMLLIIILVVVLLLGGGAFAVWKFFPGLLPGSGGNGEGGEAAPQKVEEEAGPAVLLPLSPFIVNLVDPAGKRYLKLTLDLELSSEAVKTEVTAKMPQIRDGILVHLSSLSFDDIRSVEGKMRLRTQIISRCNTFVTTGKVTNVYFSEFVVQ